ncbi:MAG TPA: hypothetical protein VFJ82_21085 [Longimicrobium sp.]|nr:hypothetical protein [Longimicrobium sp.]
MIDPEHCLAAAADVLEAGDLETQLHYAHAHLQHALRTLYRRACGTAAPLNGSCVDLARFESDLAAHGVAVDPIAIEQLRAVERLWESYLEHLDLRDYDRTAGEMPFADRFDLARRLHAGAEVRDAMLAVPATRFREVFKELYLYLRAAVEGTTGRVDRDE